MAWEPLVKREENTATPKVHGQQTKVVFFFMDDLEIPSFLESSICNSCMSPSMNLYHLISPRNLT